MRCVANVSKFLIKKWSELPLNRPDWRSVPDFLVSQFSKSCG